MGEKLGDLYSSTSILGTQTRSTPFLSVPRGRGRARLDPRGSVAPEGLGALQGRVLAWEKLHLHVSHSHCLDICLRLAISQGDLSSRLTGVLPTFSVTDGAWYPDGTHCGHADTHHIMDRWSDYR